MGILDRFFNSSKGDTDIEIPVNDAPVVVSKMAQINNEGLCSIPDLPVPFGYKTSWLAVLCDDENKVLEALNAQNIRRANWKSGIAHAYKAGDVFISPVIDEYVLVVGIDSLLEDMDKLNELGRRLGNLQYFATHRVVDYHGWAKYEAGRLVRAYCYIGESGEIPVSFGEPTREEIRLDMDNFPVSEEHFDGVDFPDEEDVIKLAAAWGVDTSFSGGGYMPSLGVVCSVGLSV